MHNPCANHGVYVCVGVWGETGKMVGTMIVERLDPHRSFLSPRGKLYLKTDSEGKQQAQHHPNSVCSFVFVYHPSSSSSSSLVCIYL